MLNLHGWRQPKGGRWRIELPALRTLPPAPTARWLASVLLGALAAVVLVCFTHVSGWLLAPIFGAIAGAELPPPPTRPGRDGEGGRAFPPQPPSGGGGPPLPPGIPPEILRRFFPPTGAMSSVSIGGGTFPPAAGFGFVNPKELGALGNNVADDTAALQAAFNTGGPVYIPPGIYRFTTLTYPSNLFVWGGGVEVTRLRQIPGTAAIGVGPASVAANNQFVSFNDLSLDFNFNANNTGGFLLQRASYCWIQRVLVLAAKTYGFAVKGSVGDGSSFNTFKGCATISMVGPDVAYLIDPTGVSYANATNIIGCTHNTTDAPFVKVSWSAGQGQPDGLIEQCHAEYSIAATALDINGVRWKVGSNRFEAAAGALTVTLNSAGSGIQAPGTFIGNQFTAPGGVVWTDTGFIRSVRIDSTMFYGAGARLAGIQDRMITLTSGAAPAIDAAQGTFFILDILTNIAVVVGIPTNPPANGNDSQEIVISIRNASGGVLTTPPTFNAGATGFKFSAVANPANGTQVLYKFRWDGIRNFWYEVGTHLAAGL